MDLGIWFSYPSAVPLCCGGIFGHDFELQQLWLVFGFYFRFRVIFISLQILVYFLPFFLMGTSALRSNTPT